MPPGMVKERTGRRRGAGVLGAGEGRRLSVGERRVSALGEGRDLLLHL